ncbi:lipopolysaccharide heptosyltransferase I [Caenimonas aquaedulcis]|uniref:Lipopolysaccharide heptosyltransferase 1 n=1 Tax=Caenimonas aquaedulcis TaxID=2793270 RepID=A0A931H7J2_9BURK|nr:lipopolysaccharide heptosyltransferase I [Caenimonas aquaedulcis]
MKILIVKLSSLGDVVHTMPAVQDIRRALLHAQIDWVVERGFAPLVQRCQGVERVIPCELRKWRKAPWSGRTRSEWRSFREVVHEVAYDAVIDLQGLTKSALVARIAKLAAGGKRYALANRTEGSSYEVPTRWVADQAIRIEPHVHAIARSRELCAKALGYTAAGADDFGLHALRGELDAPRPCVAFVHGTSREDKCWPEANWVELGRRLIAQRFCIGLPHGGAVELERAQRIADALGSPAAVWPSLDLGALTDKLAACVGVIGVDSGLSHVATALDLPHVQIYNFDTAWRTGPVGGKQQSVFAQPTPTVDAVWHAWQGVKAGG